MKLRHIVLGVAAPALLAATPAFATDLLYPTPMQMALLGDFSLGLGFSTVGQDNSDFTNSWAIPAGEARVHIPVHDGSMHLQLDAAGYGLLYEDGDGAAEARFQAHLWHMQDSLAYGLYGGLAFPGYGLATWSIGVEAEHYYGNTTLGASAGYRFGSYDFGSSPSGVRAAAYVEHYVTPDHKFGVELEYRSVDEYWYDSQWGILLSAEKRQTGTPFSYWAEAGYGKFSEPGPYDNYTWGAIAGVRIALGGTPGMTLQEHDRYLPWESQRRQWAFWDDDT